MLYVQPGTVGLADADARRSHEAVEDMDILADAEAPDFTEDTDDVEFYEWAAGEMDS
jgi:hypothetical protein